MPSNDCFSPHTGEHIPTQSPAPWMGRAGVAPPDYDVATSSAFWRGGEWEIVMAGLGEVVARRLSATEFRDRFTSAELAGITSLAYGGEGDATAQVLLLKVTTAGGGGIDLASPEVVGGLEYLVAKGRLSAARASEILA